MALTHTKGELGLGSSCLGSHDVIARSIDRPIELRCVKGRVWLTEEGCLDDILLDAGDIFTTERRGRLVVQALESEACLNVRLLDRTPRFGDALRRWLDRLVHS
ncbi:DUF2917 domain-containing protein [Labilithrix luteola]|nr:DUF2917 domain-containing protein [Labilithrix luteola]